MASNQIQCEICFNENAVGYCKTCGNVGITCIGVHKTVQVFQTHNVSLNEENIDNPTVTKRDIAEDRCKQHPTERTRFLCEIHDSLICGRCFHSEHSSCVEEVVDLFHGNISIDCNKINSMKSLFTELKAEILFLKDEAEHSRESNKDNADKCVDECMELGNKIKQRVDVLTRNIKDGIREKYEDNMNTYSHITKTCDEKTKWCDNEESKIDDFVDNKMAGRLYLVSRSFESEVSDARSHIKEIKHKHTFKGIDFKENKVILKCVFEKLGEVCEQHEEVTGSDEVHANDVDAFITGTSNVSLTTRRELGALLKKSRNEFDESEKLQTRQSLRDELKQVQYDLDNSEKTTQSLRDEVQQKYHDLDNSAKTRRELGALLKKARNELDESEKTIQSLRDEVQQKCHDLDNSEKTRRELGALLKKAGNELDESEKTRQSLRDELKQVQNDLDNSEKTIQSLRDEVQQKCHDLDNSEKTRRELGALLKKARNELDESEKARMDIEPELKGTTEALNRVERERAILQSKFAHINEHLKWTQPTGTIRVNASREILDYGKPSITVLVFTFPDGIQMTPYGSPGKPYTGVSFRGRLSSDHEGELLCRMLKAAFRRGLMFILGKRGEVDLDGVSLYNGAVYHNRYSLSQDYYD
ncbi:BICD family-like cargo adapter 2 isoform X2 [Mya arenaria]|uniref:BICD family-like cargo adapter 2 isoform X2 n=1 Tax=Mya arenaria TaxID=6604 RepID=UPI0022E3201D|nr:BICD family-like cargo adapter 2 isoform X2 [Mya arenaria]